MSAPAVGQEQSATAEASDGEQKQKKRRTPPLTSQEFTQQTNEAEAYATAIHKFYANFNKNELRTAPASPNKTETSTFVAKFSKLAKLYDCLDKKPRKKTNAPVRGFRQERFLKAHAIATLNEIGEFPAESKITPNAGAGGDGIFSRGLIISAVSLHITKSGAKRDPKNKSNVTFTPQLKALFGPVIGSIEKSKWSENEAGEIQAPLKTIQALIPKLVDSKVPIPAKMFTEVEQQRMLKRREHLDRLTGALDAENKRHDLAAKAQKAAKKAADAAADAAANPISK